METNIEIIKKKIKEAGGSDRGSLADVLLAIDMNDNNREIGHLIQKIGNIALTKWNTRMDDLTQQSEETINFLAGLLSEQTVK